MGEIGMRDVSRSGHALGSAQVADLPARVTLGELLRARINAEVAAYNADPGPTFSGLVQPEDSVRHTDGYRMDAPRPLDAGQLVTAAEEAVAAGMLSFRVGDETLTELRHEIDVENHDEVVAVLERPVIAARPS